MPNGDGLDHGTTGGWADAVPDLVPLSPEAEIAPGTRGSFADATAEVGAGSPHITRGTEVYYNGVEIINATTLEWEQEVVYDNSGTDAIGTRYKMRFRGYIHVQGVGVFGTTAPTYVNTTDGSHSTATDAYTDIKKRLWAPRGTLVVKVSSSDTVLTCYPATGHESDKDRDIDNGPKTRGLNIVQIVNNQVYKVEFSVECMKLDCKSVNVIPIVLNNRWSVSEEMDGDFYTSRTIRGHVRFSISTTENNPHNWRHIVVPGLEPNFKRERVEYAVAENGLEAEYQITDKQVYNSAPWPATDISGSYTTATNNGIKFTSSCNVRLVGGPNSPRKSLISRACQIVDNRLNYNFKRAASRCFVENATITESIGHVNTVEVSMSIQELPTTPEQFLAHLSYETLGQPLVLPPFSGEPNPPYNRQLSRAPNIYGYGANGTRDTFFLFLLACYLQSPCDNNEGHAIDNETAAGDPDLSLSVPSGTQVTAADPGTFIPLATDSSGVWSAGQKTGDFYTYCRAESKYLLKPCRAQLPIARKVEYGGQSTADTCVFIDLAPGIATREMTVDCERVNAPPDIPSPDDSYTDGSIKGRLLEHYVIGLPSSLSADGQTRIYRVRAFYRWGLNRLPNAADRLKLGALPFTSQTANTDNFFSGSQYNSILGP